MLTNRSYLQPQEKEQNTFRKQKERVVPHDQLTAMQDGQHLLNNVAAIHHQVQDATHYPPKVV